MRPKRAAGASGYPQTQEGSAERACYDAARQNRTCLNRTGSHRTRPACVRSATGKYAHPCRSPEQPIGRKLQALIGVTA